MSYDADIIKEISLKSLEHAEKTWNKVGGKLIKAHVALEDLNLLFEEEKVVSDIPGHEIVTDTEYTVDKFIAFVADMRGSSQHLLYTPQAYRADISRLQRVYYETSALLPALAKTIDFEHGQVTEYLGDGVLALFKVDTSTENEIINDAYTAAANSINQTRDIVNNILMQKFNLPQLDIGVGLGLSQAIVTLVGLKGKRQAKAFGECVFRATKLSGGKNQIIIDEELHETWHKSNEGTLYPDKIQMKDVTGYVIKKSP